MASASPKGGGAGRSRLGPPLNPPLVPGAGVTGLSVFSTKHEGWCEG